jgi:endonuclease YncB( thermonuclease family)
MTRGADSAATGRVLIVCLALLSAGSTDTLTVLDAGRTQHKIRLAGIGAPERGQAYGTVSGDNLGTLVFGKQVSVEYDKLDRYDRIVGKVSANGPDANLAQIKAGLAWHYKTFTRMSKLRYIGCQSDPS